MSHDVDIDHETLHQQSAERLARRGWPATPIRPDIEVSFEFFPPPPTSDTGLAKLRDCIDRLAPLSPSFMSITYGAGGTTQERTLTAIADAKRSVDVPIAGHLTCVGASRDEVLGVVDRYRELGVNHIVALRGDAPEDVDDPYPGFPDAASLVAGIRNHVQDPDLEISVAAYPEVHPKATSAGSDLDNLKRKVDAGATRAITQYFFDPEVFLRFLDRARAAGIGVPIVPGIMPITHFDKICSFSGRCGTSVPAWMHDLFGGLDDSPEIRSLIAATVAAEQCRRLAEHGVRTFHFYTMNQAPLSLAVCRILGVRADEVRTESKPALVG